MACETKEVRIKMIGGERRALVSQLPAMRSLRLLTRLGRVVGPSLGLLFKGDDAQLGEAISALFARLDENEVEHLVSELLFESGARIEVGGQLAEVKSVFASEFAGDLGAVGALVLEALKVNYSSFFADLAARAPEGKAAVLKFSKSSTSSGPSNG
jgi:hypothetical protein